MSGATDTLVKQALIAEIETLRDAIRDAAAPLSEAEFWAKTVQPGNSVGHLVQHLTGNLNHFVGAQLGHTGYVRDREREFTGTYAPAKAETLRLLDLAVSMFRQVVSGLTPEQLAAAHPEPRLGNVVNALVHLVAHFAIHRGQISYIVRLVKPQ
jgi:uncharacterized damage-inducible protein DinB